MSGQQTQNSDPYEVDGQAEIAEVILVQNSNSLYYPHIINALC